MKTAMMVLNYNSYELTRKLTEQVRDYQSIDHIVIIDNRSTDGSFEKLLDLADSKVHVIRTDKNGGYAKGNNFGLRYARERFNPDFFIMANPDILFSEEVVRGILEQFTENDTIGSCLMRLNGTIDLRMTAWRFPSYGKVLKETSFVASSLFKNRSDYAHELEKGVKHYVEVISRAFFIIRADRFFELGLFDERTFLFYEENILCTKVRARGEGVFVISSLYYDHIHGGSIGKVPNDVRKFMVVQNSARVYLEEALKVSKPQLRFFDLMVAWGKGEIAAKSLMKKVIGRD